MKIVHIIERFSSAGPERSLIAAAKYAAQLGLEQEHLVCTLEKTGSPVAVIMARQAGVRVLLGPDPTLRTELLTQADIVLIHFWNNPALWQFLRGPLPPMRLIFWLMILGAYPPQVVPAALFDVADLVVATTPATLDLPEFAKRGTPVIYSMADFDRLAGFAPRPHEGFNIGTIGGSLDATKLHPSFVAMSAAVQLPEAHFIICGGGGEEIRQQVEAHGLGDRFTFHGYVENIRTVLEVCDIFGYPLNPTTYATSEKVLQEAMWVGVPPVVLAHPGVRALVEDGVTGLVVEREADYAAAITWLYQHPDERERLGRNAQAYARRTFAPERLVRQFADLFAMQMAHPKRTPLWAENTSEYTFNPAAQFLVALGEHAAPFAVSRSGPPGDQRDTAEAAIAACSDLLASGEGGIFHYRNTYPDDPYLRLWAGLVLAHRGQAARAATEFQAAAAGGVRRPTLFDGPPQEEAT
ncbi:glycosyltransferase family 4 protein [Candidatus Chloroploca sp. Khr17]|uniref:glycosyltransferase family 4 protein n=1 Tax=Candidatus Chloroploca sp. Khr17 TaxID=2496869 RepID=UPI00101C6B45|nr:glycosyltransferase family 4 protein [Candidatus Chloroploca sp. Khr17]